MDGGARGYTVYPPPKAEEMKKSKREKKKKENRMRQGSKGKTHLRSMGRRFGKD
jgi:hypothetical protein